MYRLMGYALEAIMKRILILTLTLLLLTSSLFAAAGVLFELVGLGLDVAATASSGKKKVDLQNNEDAILIGGTGIKKLKKTLNENDFLVLDFEERLQLYDQLSVPVTWPIFKNILVGFGEGSALQHDTLGGLTGVLLDSASLASVGVGLGMMLIEGLTLGMFGASFSDVPDDPMMYLAKNLLIGGGIAFGVSRVIQGILPAVYGPRYNKVLRNGLGIAKDRSDARAPSLAFAPIPSKDGTLHWQVATRIPLQ